MFVSRHIKHWIIEGISFLFFLLLIYAAVSKLLVYEQFRTQLNQSPYIKKFADYLAWSIPTLEILIATLFFFPRIKLQGLYASFLFMLIFTLYIISVLNFYDSITCSSGVIIGSLTSNELLFSKITIILLAGLGILLFKKDHCINNIMKKYSSVKSRINKKLFVATKAGEAENLNKSRHLLKLNIMKTKFLIPVLAVIFAIGMSFTTVTPDPLTDALASDYVLNNGTWTAIAEQSCSKGLKTCRVQFGEGGQIFDVYDEMDLSTKKKSPTDDPKVINP